MDDHDRALGPGGGRVGAQRGGQGCRRGGLGVLVVAAAARMADAAVSPMPIIPIWRSASRRLR